MPTAMMAALPAAPRREAVLRKKLSAMDYPLPVGLLADDVMTLLEKVFSDLVATTEAYEGLQAKEENVSNELAKAQAMVFPLRKDNTKLLRENNQLHLELIKAEDETGKRYGVLMSVSVSDRAAVRGPSSVHSRN